MTCLANSSAQNIMAWGFKSGLILVLNIRTCEVIKKFVQKEPVACLSFSENENFDPRLFSTDQKGFILSWDLRKGFFRSKSQWGCGSIDYMHYIPTDSGTEIFLVGSHSGNSVQMLKSEMETVGEFELLKRRVGPQGNVRQVEFFGDKHLAVRTDDTSGEIFNCWVYNDSASTKLSDKCFNSKVNHYYFFYYQDYY